MAHPGIWGLAGLSAAFIVAGVWLNRPDRQDRPALPAQPEAAQTPLREEPLVPPRPPEPEAEPAVTRPAEVRTDAPDPEPVIEPEATAEAGTELPPKDDLPAPAQAEAAAEPAAPEPAALQPQPVTPPEPEPEPEPAADPGEAAMTEGPLVFSGPDIWLPSTNEGVDPDAIAQATRAADAMQGGALAYGAIASPRARPASRFVVQGYNELAQAEAHALALCERFQTDCVILAWRVPEGWNGSYEGTLGARQRAAWDVFSAPLPPGSFRAFAISAEGATGQAEGETLVAARAFAIVDCLNDQERVRQPGIEAGGCRVVAQRGP